MSPSLEKENLQRSQHGENQDLPALKILPPLSIYGYGWVLKQYN